MTEYDYSPEAYDRYIATQHRIANWVDNTEQHRAEFQAIAAGRPKDLSRSGPVSHPHLKRYSPSPQPRQRVAYPPPSESSDSSNSYYEGPWPTSMPQKNPAMMLPRYPPMQQPPLLPPPPMMMPPTFMHRVSHHHQHRSHDKRRSQSQHSPAYYNLVSPPPPPGYQYPYPISGGHQGYAVMPQYGRTQAPVISSSSPPLHSAPNNVTTATGYFQPQLQSNPNSQPCTPQGIAWSTYGAPPTPAQPMMSTPAGIPLQSSPYVVGVSPYQPFVQQPAQSSYFAPIAHQRVYDLSKLGSSKHYRRSIG